MRILLANTTAHPYIGGVENSLRYIGRELVLGGHEVRIFCLQFLPGEPPQMEHEGIEIIRHPCEGSRWPHRQYRNRVYAAQEGIPAVLDDFRPDAVWCRNASVGLGIRRGGYAGPLLQIFPTTAKMNCRGSFLMTGGLPVSRRLMLLGLWPSAFIVSSRIEHELLGRCTPVVFSENMRGQLTDECSLIRPGVDGEIFSPDSGARYFEAIEREYGFSRSEPLVLYVGRLSGAKHIPMLMDAVMALQYKAKLVIVGSGRDEDRLKEYARKIGLAGRVVFAGTHDEMLPGFYAMSRVCVLPTTIESFGQVYLESLASGTPVVGFGGDGRRVLTATGEIIRDGETGVVARDISAGALASGIDSILDLDDDDYDRMSRLCREDVTDRFSWKNFVQCALELSRG
jgi:glycosyltransferase involved in cell wall biosynthesis